MNICKHDELRDTPLYRVMKRNAEVDDIRKANAAKRAAFTGKAARLDDCLKDERGKEREIAAFSDRGRGAEDIRSAMEGPLWVALFDLAYEVQSEKDKKVIDALFQDMRPAVAARIANTNRQHVYRVIDRFRRDLVAAHVAWKMRDRV